MAAERSEGWLDVDSEMSGASASLDWASEKVEAAFWTDCVLSRSRFTACQFEDCQFERCVFDSCDLSAVQFIGCRFKDCYILGGKASASIAFVDTSLMGFVVDSLRSDSVEVQGCRIGQVEVGGCDFERLVFSQPIKPKRSFTSTLTLTETGLGAVGGLTALAESGTLVRVDAELWTQFGDLLLRKLGLEQI